MITLIYIVLAVSLLLNTIFIVKAFSKPKGEIIWATHGMWKIGFTDFDGNRVSSEEKAIYEIYKVENHYVLKTSGYKPKENQNYIIAVEKLNQLNTKQL